MMVHKDRLVVLSFMTTQNNNSVNPAFPTALPITVADYTGSTLDPIVNEKLSFTDRIVAGLRSFIGHEDHVKTHSASVGK